MCGIAGFYKNNNFLSFDLACQTAKKMSEVLAHRGPDFLNTWISKTDDIFLSHSRLSILDLSKNGNQPLMSKSKRFIITYNGEIYNHIDIRKKIEKKKNIIWNSSCDTETILEAIDLFGLEKTLNLVEGMFAFAIWDTKNKCLHLVRDKFGQKPLYYGIINNSLVFGSELKALKIFPNFKNKISKKSISFFLSYSYVQEPDTIYDEIYKVSPSEIVTFNLTKKNNEIINLNEKFSKTKWNNQNYSININSQDFGKKYYLEKLNVLLTKSVEQTLISDAPLGCFLSGGIDSSIITAISQRLSKKKIDTFSIGFLNQDYDESSYSKKVAKHLNTNHNEFLIDTNTIYSIFDEVIEVYDEPFADSSQIPSILLSKFTKKKVKVALTGDGADELFGGYNRYIYIEKLYRLLKFIPKLFLEKILKKLLNSQANIYLFSKVINYLAFSNNEIPQLKDKLEKVLHVLSNTENQIEIYLRLLEVNNDIDKIVTLNKENIKNFLTPEINNILKNNNINAKDKMMIIDQNYYLPGDILHKVDRSSMHYGLETRVPFLSTDIHKFSINLPGHYKIKDGMGKWILRELCKSYLPKEIYSRKKMGFSIPLNQWIKNNIKIIKNNFNSSREILKEHDINPDVVQNYLNEHISDKKNWSNIIWNFIVMERWLNKNT